MSVKRVDIVFHTSPLLTDSYPESLICLFTQGPACALIFNPPADISHSAAVLRHASTLLALRTQIKSDVIRLTLDIDCSVDTAIAAILAKRLLENPDNPPDFAHRKSLEDWTPFNWRVKNTTEATLFALAVYATREKHGLPIPCPPYQRLGAIIRALQYLGDPLGLPAAFEKLLNDTRAGLAEAHGVASVMHPMLGANLDSTTDFRWKQFRAWIESDYQKFRQVISNGESVALPRMVSSEPRFELCLLVDQRPAELWSYWCDAGVFAEAGLPLDHLVVLDAGARILQWSGRGVEPLPELAASAPISTMIGSLDLSVVQERIQNYADRVWINDFQLNVVGDDYAYDDQAAHLAGTLCTRTWDTLLSSVPNGIFRFAKIELPEKFGDLTDARLRQSLASFMWRVIRPSPRIGLPADFEERHLRSDVGLLCCWSRCGMVLAHTRRGLQTVDHLAVEFQHLAKLSLRASRLIPAGNDPNVNREVLSLLHDYSKFKQKLVQPQYRLLRRFWEAVNQHEVMESLWKRWESDAQSKSLTTISSVQTKLEYFEALIIAFYGIELAEKFTRVLKFKAAEDARELLILAGVGLFLGIFAFRALVDTDHPSQETSRERNAKRIVRWSVTLILVVAAAVSIYYLYKPWNPKP